MADSKRRGLLIILSSPSGAGKSTLAKRLRAWDNSIVFSVSATTRKPRPGEVNGVDYHFVSEPEFKKTVAEGGMLEHAHVFGNFYGSPKAAVEEAINAGKDVLFDIDWQRAADREFRSRPPHAFGLSAAALDHRAAPPARDPRPGQRRGDLEADAEKLGRDKPLGKLRFRSGE